MHFKTPILFLVFNRLETTEKVFSVIRKLQPRFLYVAADGPRGYVEGEKDKCKVVQESILQSIDWDCNVETLFREDNLGCGLAVSSAISWFFEHVEEGIILEDDCLPDLSFFSFCEELLEKYKSDESILHISGSDYANDLTKKESYYFTRLPFIWGWATWRRAWKKYDYNTKYLSIEDKRKILSEAFEDAEIVEYWMDAFREFHLKPRTYTWDYQWFMSIWKNGGFVIQPQKNLVRNIGFGSDATHTTGGMGFLSAVKESSMTSICEHLDVRLDGSLQKQNFDFYFKNEECRKTPHATNIVSLVKKAKSMIGSIIFKFLLNYKSVHVVDDKSICLENTFADSSKGKYVKIGTNHAITNSSIGDFTFVDDNASINNTTIGKYCSIGVNCVCGENILQAESFLATSPMFYSTSKHNGITLAHHDKIKRESGVEIGNDVSIGNNVTINNGVVIGDGVIVLPGSVILENIPAYAVVSGNPAKVIKYRFDDSEIEKLMSIKWWNWPDNKLHLVEDSLENIAEFTSKNVDDSSA